MKNYYDIVIVGGGVVGAATALAIAKQSSLTVAVVEAKKTEFTQHAQHTYDARVSAISHTSKKILQRVNAWPAIQAKRMSPYAKMHVWDAEGDGFITFDAADIGESNLGYIIEDGVIRASLLEQVSACENLDYLNPVTILKLTEIEEKIILMSEDNHLIETKLLIAADGAESWCRKSRNIGLKTYDYQHSAIIANVHTSLPHQQTARQRFLPTGPLAFLPFENAHASSIVWSTSAEEASRLMALDDEAFQIELARSFDYTLGEVTQVSKRHVFPLRMRHAKNYVQNRFALVGDAAHTVHPLAGQGVNLGLLDAAALAEVVVQAYRKKRDFASLATLRKYERWRKGDTLAMLTMVEFLKQLFAHQNTFVQRARNIGLTFTHQMTWVKNFFTQYALGKRSDLPDIAH